MQDLLRRPVPNDKRGLIDEVERHAPEEMLGIGQRDRVFRKIDEFTSLVGQEIHDLPYRGLIVRGMAGPAIFQRCPDGRNAFFALQGRLFIDPPQQGRALIFRNVVLVNRDAVFVQIPLALFQIAGRFR